MRAQLRHLREFGERSDADLRVLPFSAGAHASPNGSFTLLKMAAPFPGVVHVESPAGAIYLETDEVDRFVDRYHHLHGQSLGRAESAAFIAALEKEHR